MCILYNSINDMQKCILNTPKKIIQHQWVTTVTTLSASAPSARPASPQTTESSDGYPHRGAQQTVGFFQNVHGREKVTTMVD